MPEPQPSFEARWHDDLERPDPNLSQRLSVVQRLREAIDRAAGLLSLISVCVGQGCDAEPLGFRDDLQEFSFIE